MVRVLAVIFSCLHLQNVGNDAVDGDVTYQAGEKELLCDAGVHEAQGWEARKYTGQSRKIKNNHLSQLTSLCIKFTLKPSSNVPKYLHNIYV